MADRQSTRIMESLRSRVSGPRDGMAWRAHQDRGKVTVAASADGPWTVAGLLEDGTASGTVWSPCWTYPPGGTVAVGDIVMLWFERPDVPPVIVQSGVGSGGPRPCVITVANGDGTVDLDLLDFDLVTVLGSYEDVPLIVDGGVVAGDRGILLANPNGVGWAALI